ncbi:MAG: PEP-CTERM sorting domain-containing protein [Gammaproteobacteria bacterium]
MLKAKSVGPFSRIAVAAVFLASGAAAQAVPVTWVDTWNPPGREKLNKRNKTYTFTHDIKDQGYRPGIDRVFSAKLWIDLADNTGRKRDKESGRILLADLSAGKFKGQVRDYRRKVIGQALYSLTDTGMLEVTVKRNSGNFYFKKARLRVKGKLGAVVPVGEPGTVGLLGIGLLGLMSTAAVRRRRER